MRSRLNAVFDMPDGRGKLTPPEKRLERELAVRERLDRLEEQERPSYDDLAAGLQGGFGAAMNERYGRLIAGRNLWTEALRLAFHDDDRVAFRASWVLEWAYFNHKEAFVPYIEIFIEGYLKSENPSVHRHYSKMLHDMMRGGIFVPDAARAERIAEKAFDLLIAPQVKSAVRIWSAEILYQLSSRLDWVGDHLDEVLRQQLEAIPTPAIISHYGKLLKKIARR